MLMTLVVIPDGDAARWIYLLLSLRERILQSFTHEVSHIIDSFRVGIVR